uniref:Microfibril associated protein 4 n=1 Tax=Tetraodon nigroviridis TaxID=99883 RepID=H3CF03_TETNG
SLVLLLLMTPILASGHLVSMPADCSEIHHSPSGEYTIFPAGERSAVLVKCDMDTDQGGWTVISARTDGTVNFYRPWNQYKIGFGSPLSEHWIGLNNLHYMTNNKKYELRVVLEDFDGKTVFANYGSFSVGDECSGYQLTVGGFTDGGAGDALSHHNQMKFTTLDRDNDLYENNCAKEFLGAFWYNSCHHTNPNGVYRWGVDGTLYAVGVIWHPWKGHAYSLKKYIMMIRPVQ